MFLTETAYFDGKPVGVIRQCTNTGQIAFTPLQGSSRIWDQQWCSINELKRAMEEYYGRAPEDEPK